MFGIDSSELLLIAIVALVVIGPKDMPRVMRLVGGWIGRGRAMTRHLRAGFDTMMREAELEEMQKQWAQQNAEIMAATQVAPVSGAMPTEPAVTDEPYARAYGSAMSGPQPPAQVQVEAPAIPPEPLAQPSSAPSSQPLPEPHR